MAVSVLRTLAIRLSMNTAAFRKDVHKVDASMRRLSRNMRRDAQMINGSLAQIGGSFIAAFGGHAVVQAADSMQNLRNKMGAAFDSSTDVARGMLDIRRIARQSRADIDSVGTLYQRVRVATDSLGASQEQVAALTQVVTNSFLLSGTTASEAANSARQFAQGLASGALRGDEYRSVSENNVVLTKMLADGFKVNVGQLRQLAAQGAITADKMLSILVPGLQWTIDQVDEMQVTIGQASTIMKNQFVSAIDRVNQHFGLAKAGSRFMLTLANNMHQVIAAGGVLVTLFAARLLKALVAWTVIGIWGAIAGTGRLIFNVGVLSAKLAGQFLTGVALATRSILKFSVALLASPITWIVAGIAAVITAFTHLNLRFEIFSKVVRFFSEELLPQFSNAWERIVNVLDVMKARAGLLFAFLGEKLNAFIERAGLDISPFDLGNVDEARSRLDALIETQDKLGAKAEELRTSVGDTLSHMFTVEDPTTLADRLRSTINDVIQAATPEGGLAAVTGMMGSDSFAAMLGSMGTTLDEFLTTYFPRIKEFMDVLSGRTDADRDMAGGSAEGGGDNRGLGEMWRDATWGERWIASIEAVRKSWDGLVTDYQAGIETMRAGYDSWGEILGGFAKKSAAANAVMKAIYLQQAIMAQKTAIADAWATPGGIAPKLAAVALVTAQTALIIKDLMSGKGPALSNNMKSSNQAHDGIDFVPNSGTWLLEKGERVVDSRLNADLTRFLQQETGGGVSRKGGDVNLNVSGVSDPDLVIDALTQRRGELESLVRQIAAEQATASPFA